MRKNRENKAGNELIKGNIIGAAAIIIMSLIASAVLLKADISRENYIYPLIGVAALSGIFAGFSGTRQLRKNGLVSGVLSSVSPFVLLMVAMTVANKGFMSYELLPALAVPLGGIIGGISAVNIKTKKKKIKK